MSWFSTILSYVTAENIQTWAGVISLWIIAFRALADLTPSDKDNKVLGWVETVFAVLGAKVPNVQAAK